ncbi:hypothetical protein [Sporisorium scitamineum]|uniref:Uncharacterized protein n=1 Tax=Sporisorium scitamineum TaxID=49012 RepID=A0A0F7S901_9BASI|nr:hypothetical protein [Sporisorium scitamineum]
MPASSQSSATAHPLVPSSTPTPALPAPTASALVVTAALQVPPNFPADLAALLAPVAQPDFVSCSNLALSVGKLCQFFQDELSQVVQVVQSLSSMVTMTQSATTSSAPTPPPLQAQPPAVTLPLAPPTLPACSAQEEAPAVMVDSFKIIKAPTTASTNHQFFKSVPNFETFSCLWTIYSSIHASSLLDCNLLVGLGLFYIHIAEVTNIFPWSCVVNYIVAICTERFGQEVCYLWNSGKCNPVEQIFAILTSHSSSPAPASHSASTSSALSLYSDPSASQTNTVDAQHILSFYSSPPMPQFDIIGTIGVLSHHSSSSFPSTSLTSLNPLVVLLADLALAALSPLQSHLPPSRPNTTIVEPLFDPADQPACHSLMQALLATWESLLSTYPDCHFVSQLLGAIHHGICLGYSGPLHDSSQYTHVKNLPMDATSVGHIQAELTTCLQEHCIVKVDPESCNLVCSLVSTIPKLCSTKLHTIHHLSHPHLPQAHQLLSVNAGISQHFTTIRYASIASILSFVWAHPGTHFWKSDLTDAFCHMSTTTHPVEHYLDDFFGMVPVPDDPACPLHNLALICCMLGMQLAPNKTSWNETHLEILGIEINIICQMAGITNEQHQCILGSIDLLLTRCSAYLLDWQRIAGLLQFVSQVVPHTKAYLRCLYDASKATHHPLALQRIPQPAAAELHWWRVHV